MSIPGLPEPRPLGRVITYIDGFNLYFGLRDSGWRRYLWLDLVKLAGMLTLDHQDLVETKYFSSRIVDPPDKKKRQSTYLEALEAHCGPSLRMYFGHSRTDPWRCDRCGSEREVPSEKKTDVNIAVEVMTDAFQDRFDTAMIVSADSDLLPAVSAMKRLHPNKRIVIAFPPNRYSVELHKGAHTAFTVGRARFAQSQMPDTVTKADGTRLTRPPKWSTTQTDFGRKVGKALGQGQ